jgi:hypothetical protein
VYPSHRSFWVSARETGAFGDLFGAPENLGKNFCAKIFAVTENKIRPDPVEGPGGKDPGSSPRLARRRGKRIE